MECDEQVTALLSPRHIVSQIQLWLTFFIYVNKQRESVGSGWGVPFPLTQSYVWVYLVLVVWVILKRNLQLSFTMSGQITWLFNWSLSQTQLALFATKSTNIKVLYFSVRNQFTAEHALCKHTGSHYSTVCSQGKTRKAISEKAMNLRIFHLAFKFAM